MLKKLFDDEPVLVRGAVLIVFMLASWLGLPVSEHAKDAINLVGLGAYLFITRMKVTPNHQVVLKTADLPQPQPSAAVPPAQSPKERLPMNIGNWFDSIFKKPWLDVVHGVEHSPETLALQAKAEADIAAAKDAVATAVASHEAAAQASVSGVVDNALNAGLSHIPVIGPLITGEADAVANNFTDNAIHSLIGKLEGFLSPGFNAPAI